MFSLDENQSLLNVMQSSKDESIEIPSISSNCLSLSELCLTAQMFRLAITSYNRVLILICLKFQNCFTWALANTVSSLNLMSCAFNNELFAQPTVRPTNGIPIVAGYGQNIALVGL